MERNGVGEEWCRRGMVWERNDVGEE